jgi:hypothetical protein
VEQEYFACRTTTIPTTTKSTTIKKGGTTLPTAAAAPKKNTFQWNLLGHSAGAFGAMHLYQQFQSQQRRRQSGDDDKTITGTTTTTTTPTTATIHVDKLILWGCAAMVDMSTDLSNIVSVDDNNDDDDDGGGEPKILRVQATQDSLVERMKDFQDEFDQHFPTSGTTVTQWISGGTHQGFASYESTWAGSPNVDSAISCAEQQQKACDLTIQFLRLGRGGGGSVNNRTATTTTTTTTIPDEDRG